jgi:hypothetical protein
VVLLGILQDGSTRASPLTPNLLRGRLFVRNFSNVEMLITISCKILEYSTRKCTELGCGS